MTRTTTPHPFSDSFWPSSSKHFSNSTPFYKKKREDEQDLNKFLSIDESPEFYDPYSALNLFLSKKIKQECPTRGASRRWSPKIQEELLEKIAPEFQTQFPQYRLGVTALKKVWEKASYYRQQFEGKKQAFTEEGNLDIHFLIRENLKDYTYTKHFLSLHPSHFSHQLGRKLGECIAIVDGEKIKLDALTQLIWSVQRNLIPYKDLAEIPPQSPYDTYDANDRLILQAMVKLLAKQTPDWKTLKKEIEEFVPASSEALEQKIERWALQSDMIYGKILLDPKDPLFSLICSNYTALKEPCSHEQFVERICAHYHPHVDDNLYTRVWILYKHAWYTQFASPEETPYGRFLKWHGTHQAEVLPLYAERDFSPQKKNPQ